jgi:hypothetical protein
MSPEVQAHLFEPFFTTKAWARGPGWAWPAVFGIVEASEGFLSVSTTPGAGTEIHVVSPGDYRRREGQPRTGPRPSIRLLAATRPCCWSRTRRRGAPPGANAILTEHGYRVLTASSGQGALDFCWHPAWVPSTC